MYDIFEYVSYLSYYKALPCTTPLSLCETNDIPPLQQSEQLRNTLLPLSMTQITQTGSNVMFPNT